MINKNEILKTLNTEDKNLLQQNPNEFLEVYLDRLSENIDLDLPKPDNTNMQNLKAEFDLYNEGLDAVINSLISEEIISENVSGTVSEHIDAIKNNYKHALLRKWMVNNNYFPEAFDVFDKDNNENKEVDGISNHLTSVMKFITDMLLNMEKFKTAANKDLESVSGQDASGSGGYTSSGGDNSSDTGDGSDENGDVTDDSDFGLEL